MGSDLWTSKKTEVGDNSTITVTTTTTIPANTSVTLILFEDVGNDGSGGNTDALGNNYDNSSSTALSGGTDETNDLGGFDGGGSTNAYWVHVEIDGDGSDPSVESPTLDKIDVAPAAAAITQTVSDALNFNENTLTQLNSLQTDTLDFTEATQSKLVDQLQDALGFTEAEAFKLVNTFTDTLNFTENITAKLIIAVLTTDQLDFTENTVTQLQDTLQDTLDFTENIPAILQDTRTDSLDFQENVVAALIATLTDSLTFTENTNIILKAVLADTLLFQENTLSVLQDTFTDSLDFTENTAAQIPGILEATVTDQLQFQEDFNILLKTVFTEQLDFTENLATTLADTFTDSLNLTDQVTALEVLALDITIPTKAIITTKENIVSMENKTFKQGDLGNTLTATLEDADGPVDLSNAKNVKIVMQDRNGTKQLDTNVTISNASNGEIKYEWNSNDPIDTIGIYRCEFIVVDNADKEETFPNDGFVIIEVEEDI